MHPAWGTYPDTLLRFPGTGLSIDLRRPVSADARGALAALGLGGPFGVLTAQNPLGNPLDGPANGRLATLLHAVVRERYPGALPVQGTSPDGTHVEEGWALPVPLEEVRALAARFFQNAVFWFDADRFFIVPVLASYPPLALPDRTALP